MSSNAAVIFLENRLITSSVISLVKELNENFDIHRAVSPLDLGTDVFGVQVVVGRTTSTGQVPLSPVGPCKRQGEAEKQLPR